MDQVAIWDGLSDFLRFWKFEWIVLIIPEVGGFENLGFAPRFYINPNLSCLWHESKRASTILI